MVWLLRMYSVNSDGRQLKYEHNVTSVMNQVPSIDYTEGPTYCHTHRVHKIYYIIQDIRLCFEYEKYYDFAG